MLELFNGTIREADPKKPNLFYEVNFKKHSIKLDLTEKLSDGKITKKLTYSKTTIEIKGQRIRLLANPS